MSRFVIVGAPGMGKSTLLRFIPTIIQRATCIDLERTGFPNDQARLREFAAMLLDGDWDGPLFLGNAAACSIEIANVGYEVIALHHHDRERYLQRMNQRDEERGSDSQGDFWEYHRKRFLETMPENGIVPFLVDTLSPEFDRQLNRCVRHVASHFSLATWPDE